MRDSDLRELEKTLNNLDLSDYEAGKKVCSLLGTSFNCFGSFEKIAKQICEELVPSAKKNLKAAVLLGLVALAQESTYAGRYFGVDERKKASLSFASKNADKLIREFYKLTDIPIQVQSTGHSLYYDTCRKDFQGKAFFYGFLEKWGNEHPTIQQAIVKGFVLGILDTDSYEPPLDYAEVGFPFI